MSAPARREPIEFTITLQSQPGEGLVQLFRRLANQLREREATILKLLILGSVQAHEFARIAMRQVFGAVDWPVTWAQGTSCLDHPIAGIQAFAVTGKGVQRIVVDGRVLGSVFEDEMARHCLLGGLGPGVAEGTPARQTHRTLEQMERVLEEAGFAMTNLVRTWFYLNHLLSWYRDFNHVRTNVYSSIDFQLGATPASTAVSGRNPSGAALIAAAWAIQPKPRGGGVRTLSSPLQGPAPAYGSAFSRAVEWNTPGGRRLLISGTASISPEGTTLWEGDAARQIGRSMEVVDAILRSRDMEFADITRATAYFRNAADLKLFNRWRAERNLALLPVVAAQCDICRDDLLFELEADAWGEAAGDPGQAPEFLV